jgi:hypothetical protein
MLAGVVMAVCLVPAPTTGYNSSVPWIEAVLLTVVWTFALLVQVSQHERLGRAYERETAQTSVRSNWLRTLA